MQSVLVHFDVSEQFVLLETFVSSANAASRSVKALNEELFEGQLVIELVVFPPAPGSVRQYIGVTIKSIKSISVRAGVTYAFLWSLIQLMDSQTVRDVSEELLGSTPSEMLIERIRDFRGRVELEDGSEVEAQRLQEEGLGIVEEIIVQGTASALGAPPKQLEADTIPPALGYELRLAQSELFASALEDRNIRGISFREDEPHPILRSQFAVRGVRPLPLRPEEEEENWEMSLQQLRITSPVFERDEPQRKWMGINTKGATVLFDIMDSEFWDRLPLKEIKFSDGSRIVVQMATRVGRRGPKERRVVRVLDLDGVKLAEPLDANALASILGEIKGRPSDMQDELF